jgi:negative regulator of sigma E activity
MKRLFVILISVIAAGTLYAQNLDKVIEKHLEAINAEKLSQFKSLYIKGHISMAGMQIDMEMYEKAPDKIKSVGTFNGMDMVQVINGDRGYMINPMMGSYEPVPLTADQVASMRITSMLNSSLENAYRQGNMVMEGEEAVGGRPAFKIKITSPEGTRYIFIDKESYYLVQMRMDVFQMGSESTVELRMRDFTDTDGVIMARTIDTYMNGDPAGTAFYETIEFNREIDDSEFEIK